MSDTVHFGALNTGVLQCHRHCQKLFSRFVGKRFSITSRQGRDEGDMANIVDRALSSQAYSWIIHDCDSQGPRLEQWSKLSHRFSEEGFNSAIEELATKTKWALSIVTPYQDIQAEGYVLFVSSHSDIANRVLSPINLEPNGFMHSQSQAFFRVESFELQNGWQFGSIALENGRGIDNKTSWEEIWQCLKNYGCQSAIAPSGAADYLELYRESLKDESIELESIHEVEIIPRTGLSIYNLRRCAELAFLRWCANVWDDTLVMLFPESQRGSAIQLVPHAQRIECWDYPKVEPELEWLLDLGKLSSNAYFTSQDAKLVKTVYKLSNVTAVL